MGTGWRDDFAGVAASTAEPAVERQQWAVQRLGHSDVPSIVASQVASQRPYPLSKGREGKQFYFQAHQICMGGGSFNAGYFCTLLQSAQDIAGFCQS